MRDGRAGGVDASSRVFARARAGRLADVVAPWVDTCAVDRAVERVELGPHAGARRGVVSKASRFVMPREIVSAHAIDEIVHALLLMQSYSLGTGLRPLPDGPAG